MIDQKQQEPKRKRAKIESACSECRRKKTKCDGEQPCHNCNKTKSNCIYNASSHNEKRGNHNALPKSALESIEMRLKAIEDMLKMLLEQQLSSTYSSHNRLPSIKSFDNDHDYPLLIPFGISLHNRASNGTTTLHENNYLLNYKPTNKRKHPS